MQREDTYRITATVDGVDLTGIVWDKLAGGEGDSEETTYRPGGLADQVTLGGQRTLSNVTITRLNDKAIHDKVHALYGRRGRAGATITKQPLDADGNAFGRPLVYTGKLKTCTPPNVDSEGNGAALFALVVSCEGDVK